MNCLVYVPLGRKNGSSSGCSMASKPQTNGGLAAWMTVTENKKLMSLMLTVLKAFMVLLLFSCLGWFITPRSERCSIPEVPSPVAPGVAGAPSLS